MFAVQFILEVLNNKKNGYFKLILIEKISNSYIELKVVLSGRLTWLNITSNPISKIFFKERQGKALQSLLIYIIIHYNLYI